MTLEGPGGLLPHEKICNEWNIPLQFHVTPAARTLPAGARLLRVQNVGVGADTSEADSNEGPLCKAVFGVPWDVDEFLEHARSVVHPKNLRTGIPH